MTFSAYMNAWLYGPEGYYTNYKEIGKQGDFYTSVSTSKFFGGTIAKHIVTLVDEGFLKQNATLCEIGAHHGYLMADIIEFLYTLRPKLLETFSFVIIERKEELQAHQKAYFNECFGDVITLKHYTSLSDMNVNNAFFYANEIFDAFPCELFYKGKIAEVQDHEIVFEREDKAITALATHQNRDRGEIAVGYEEFAQTMSQAANKFEFMTFDYGEMAARSDYSIRVYADHKVIPLFDEDFDRKKYFGNADITYDVVFSHVKEAFESAGIAFISFEAQMTALVNMGLLDLLAVLHDKADEKIYKQELEKAKMLIMPDFLGERFKMIKFRQG
ncbi:MAG TPA: hypothetical protein ENK65_00085 [Helicobacteraceae bacterium]|nr:hypothetical protein [Helicobacteraceae bacterium]